MNSASTWAPENGNTITFSKRCNVRELPVQRQQDVVDDQEAVLRVGGDPAELVGRQPQVQRVHHAAGRRNAEVALQVRMVVPAQRGHAVAALQAELQQRRGRGARARGVLAVAVAAQRLVGQPRDDLVAREDRARALEHVVQRQADVHHRGLHGSSPPAITMKLHLLRAARLASLQQRPVQLEHLLHVRARLVDRRHLAAAAAHGFVAGAPRGQRDVDAPMALDQVGHQARADADVGARLGQPRGDVARVSGPWPCNGAAVAGMICIRPTAPRGDTARSLKPDSTAISALISSRVHAVARGGFAHPGLHALDLGGDVQPGEHGRRRRGLAGHLDRLRAPTPRASPSTRP